MQNARHLKKSFNQLGKYCLSSISLAEFRSLQFSSPPVMPVSKVYAFPFMQYRCPVYALGNVEDFRCTTNTAEQAMSTPPLNAYSSIIAKSDNTTWCIMTCTAERRLTW